MRLYEFVPILDSVIENDSLIDRVFGQEFCVVDETGHLLTTAHNQDLLRQAKMLVDQSDSLGLDALVESLWALRIGAECMTQRDYEVAVRREILYSDADHTYDYSLEAGSLA